jgi:hypothetical protein
MNSFTTQLCTAARRMWRFKSPYSAPRPALKCLCVRMCGGKGGSDKRVSQCASTTGRHLQHHKCLTLISRRSGYASLPRLSVSSSDQSISYLDRSFLLSKFSVTCVTKRHCQPSSTRSVGDRQVNVYGTLVERYWQDKTKVLGGGCISATLSTTNPTRTSRITNPDLSAERQIWLWHCAVQQMGTDVSRVTNYIPENVTLKKSLQSSETSVSIYLNIHQPRCKNTKPHMNFIIYGKLCCWCFNEYTTQTNTAVWHITDCTVYESHHIFIL